MAVDLTIEPWLRLSRLAPPGTNSADMQAAAQRWAITADVYAAAADIWEEKALMIDLGPDADYSSTEDGRQAPVTSVSQDGITVNYAVSNQSGNTQSARRAQATQIRNIVRRLRALAKPQSLLVHDPNYNPWLNTARPQNYDDPLFPENYWDVIIPVIE